MQLNQINPFTLININNDELNNLHNLCHYYWGRSIAFTLSRAITKVGVKESHKYVVNELRKRNLSHTYKDNLDDGINYLTESSPKNPEKIILRNKIYPEGLTEREIYDYYQNVKLPLLKYLSTRSVSFYLYVNKEIVIKRKPKIILTNTNFDKIITGRTISLHINRDSKPTNYIVLDIDRGEGINDNQLLEAVDCSKKLFHNHFKDLIKKTEILFTGSGLHYIIYFHKFYDLDKLREIVIKLLHNQEKYPVGTGLKKRPNIINFDMCCNWKKSMHISKYSLNKEGLRVADIREIGVILNPLKYKI